MTDMPLILDEPSAVPAFAFAAFDINVSDIELTVHMPKVPEIRRHASLGLLYGLAIMELDALGILADKVEELLEDGPINEVDAQNRINTLLDRTQ